MMCLVVEHSRLSTAAAPAFLPADFLDAGAFGIDVTFLERFDLVEQQPAGKEAVESLLARGLALDLNSRRPVEQHHARGSLVDVLAAVSTRADERFLDVGFAHAERGHPLRKLRRLFGADRECTHAGSLRGRPRRGQFSYFAQIELASGEVGQGANAGSERNNQFRPDLSRLLLSDCAVSENILNRQSINRGSSEIPVIQIAIHGIGYCHAKILLQAALVEGGINRTPECWLKTMETHRILEFSECCWVAKQFSDC